MSTGFSRQRVLIIAKTYPELSKRYTETVCTAAVTEAGRPLRLYPVPLRYLETEGQYSTFNWIDVAIAKSTSDSRPESYKVDATSIRVDGSIPTDKHEWRERANFVFKDPSWQFDGMASLQAAQLQHRTSLGIVKPGVVDGVLLRSKPDAARAEYEQKARDLSSRIDIFHPQYKDLEYRDHEIVLLWRCESRCTRCAKAPHNMQVLDWGLIELARKYGWDWEKARQKLESIVNPSTHDFRLILGNTKAHQRNFLVVGLWYPRLREQASLL